MWMCVFATVRKKKWNLRDFLLIIWFKSFLWYWVQTFFVFCILSWRRLSCWSLYISEKRRSSATLPQCLCLKGLNLSSRKILLLCVKRPNSWHMSSRWAALTNGDVLTGKSTLNDKDVSHLNPATGNLQITSVGRGDKYLFVRLFHSQYHCCRAPCFTETGMIMIYI